MKYLLIFLLVLAIFVISVTLGAQNDQQVSFNYLLAQGEYRVSSLLAVLFAAGFVIGWLVCGLFWLKVRVSLVRAERKIKRLEHQLTPASDIPASSGVPVVRIIEYAGVVVSAFACRRSLWLVYGPQKRATNKTG